MWSLVFYIVLFTIVFAEKRDFRLVEISQGPVRGYKNDEFGIFEFHGIPYATAPTGPNRFKAPMPPPSWTEPFDAIDEGIVCPQRDYLGTMSKNVKEDCLIASVYVPAKQETNIPVVVYVHGGGFIMGHGNFLTPRNLVSGKKVIVVTFNYRLAGHGFLCLGTNDIPGNAAMKDQVALLRWVNKNIESFGGNPNEVTLAGYSAGSSSVELLMLSQMTKGLFKRVIPESGSSIGAYSFQLNPLRVAQEYAKLLNFDKIEDTYALEEFFKSVPIEQLNSVDVSYGLNFTFLVTPCIERKTSEESFLTDSPINILKSGNYNKVPMLYGFSNMEGLLCIPQFETWKNEMNKNFYKFLPADLQFENKNEREEVANRVKQLYFGDKPVGSETVLAYVDFCSDLFFTYPILKSVKLQVEAGNNNIYLYEYSYVDANTPLVPYTETRGASHCSQTYAVLDPIESQTVRSEEYQTMVEYMRNIWYSFIKTGYPIPKKSDLSEWPVVGKNWSPYMSLNRTLELRESLLKDRTILWEEIYHKHYQMPLPPPTLPFKKIDL